ncbi:MAG: acetate/propionate family kinase [Paucibacter sp.]|nr:acetate/propionate family kinase [Roseateles sp.]
MNAAVRAAGVVLALNAGSASIKLALFAADDGRELARGSVDLQQERLALVLQRDGQHEVLPLDAPLTDPLHEVVDALLEQLEAHHALGELAATAHRVVHGGQRFGGAVRIDPATLDAIEALTPLAPLHQPHSVRLIRAVSALRPALPQTASFDTAFHASQDPLLRRFALPRALHDEGLLRYGFHGLSYAYIAAELARRAPAIAASRVVALHLGSGASLCAMRGGVSVDSSMGFSTLDGVPMGTRCGALDPGALLYLLQQRGMTLAEVEALLYHRSGLLGVSGLSADMRELRRQAGAVPAAAEAIELFARRCAGEVARLAASLGGVDALVFTAGIGEHDAATRADIAARLGWLGLTIDASANAASALRIDAPGSAIAAFVMPTDEERTLVNEALALLG